MSNVTIVIQGPTNYYQQILENLSPNQKYIWSTWDNEPKEALDAISNKIELVTSHPLDYPGYANVNCQCFSTLEGINNADTNYIFKTRGDMIFNDIDKLISILSSQDKELAFFHYGNPPKQIADFFSFGSVENSRKFWYYYTNDSYNTAPEMRLTNQYKQNVAPNDSFEEFVKRFYFFNHHMIKDNVDIKWLKVDRMLSSFNKENANLYPRV